MLSAFDPTRSVASPLRVTFTGAPVSHATPAVQIETPWLAGAAAEELFPMAVPIGTERGCELFRSGDLLLGRAREPFVATDLAARSEALYRRVIAAAEGRHLYRIWNYVPQINVETEGLEHYRGFCKGRSLAFEHALGAGFQPRLPAASAVGSRSTHLEAIFVAGAAAPRHFENPEQVPAYCYPPEHGPRPPSFARATLARADGRDYVFISGTAAITGHQTIAPGALEPQLERTLHNLHLVGRATGLGENLALAGAVRHFKVYLRHASDLAAARRFLERALFTPSDVVTYLQGEVCRAALVVEIEATLIRRLG